MRRRQSFLLLPLSSPVRISSVPYALALVWLTASFACSQESAPDFNLKTDVEWPGEVSGPTRMWTPVNRNGDTDPLDLHGPPFTATLRGVFNEDTPYSREFAIFDLADGTVQGYATCSFVDSDREFLHRFAAQMPAAQAKPTAYPSAPTPQECALRDAHQAASYDSPHFSFWFGNPPSGTGEDGRLVSNPDFVPTAARWYEKIWQHFTVEAGAPMPHAGEEAKKKINVVLSNSGYPGATGFANSAESMGLEPIAMQYGSCVVPHEFTHVIQYYTGGFRDSKSVGAFWETHANFGAFTFAPTTLYAVPSYFSALEKGFQWYDYRYASWPFLMQLYEQKRTRALVFNIWLKNHRDVNGASVEDPLETMVRLGQEDDSLPKGWESLADEWGELGERLVTWDYIHHTYYEAATRDYRQKAYVKLTPQGGNFLPPGDRPLRAYGIHFIHLRPIDRAKPLEVRLTGLTETQSASWRFSLVAVAPDGKPRYGEMGKVDGLQSGTIDLPVHSQDNLTLVVVATPLKYIAVNWGDLPPNVFPYALELTNAAAE